MSKRRIGILTSGGDCPGLNAVLRGAVRAAEEAGMEVIGFLEGFEGLLNGGSYLVLDRARTAGIMHLGGTILGTTNKGRFGSKKRGGSRGSQGLDVFDDASRTLQQLGIEALITVGGDGSLSTSLQMFRAGFPVVGVPKTIDNDLQATAKTFGFDSAVACVAEALDRLHTTATSHRRIMVLEVMGRHAGWIALHGGLAGGGDIILIPEIPFTFEAIMRCIEQRERIGCTSHMVVVAEGASPANMRQQTVTTSTGDHRLGGIGELVAREIGKRTSREVRSCVLGHMQRGGAPTTLDRILGTRFGVHAVQLVRDGKFGMMVSYDNYLIKEVPLANAVHRIRRIQRDDQMIATARNVGISFGD